MINAGRGRATGGSTTVSVTPQSVPVRTRQATGAGYRSSQRAAKGGCKFGSGDTGSAAPDDKFVPRRALQCERGWCRCGERGRRRGPERSCTLSITTAKRTVQETRCCRAWTAARFLFDPSGRAAGGWMHSRIQAQSCASRVCARGACFRRRLPDPRPSLPEARPCRPEARPSLQPPLLRKSFYRQASLLRMFRKRGASSRVSGRWMHTLSNTY